MLAYHKNETRTNDFGPHQIVVEDDVEHPVEMVFGTQVGPGRVGDMFGAQGPKRDNGAAVR